MKKLTLLIAVLMSLLPGLTIPLTVHAATLYANTFTTQTDNWVMTGSPTNMNSSGIACLASPIPVCNTDAVYTP